MEGDETDTFDIRLARCKLSQIRMFVSGTLLSLAQIKRATHLHFCGWKLI